MTMLFNGWFPDGSAATKLSGHAYFNRLGQTSVSPVVQVPGSCDLVANPSNPAETVLQTRYNQSDVRFSDTSVRVMMLPVTPTAADPITDWAGQSAARRWYRFAFRADVWPEEPQRISNMQGTVVWQLHDQADTGDNFVEPPLWLEDDGRGGWGLWNTYDPNVITTLGTRTHRLLTRFPRTLGKWEEIVIWMKPSWTSGALKVWRDQKLIFQETGVPNCFNHQIANGGSYNYVEYGVYGGKTGQLQDRRALHKGAQIGDEAYATFNDFMVACGSSLTEQTATFTGTFNL